MSLFYQRLKDDRFKTMTLVIDRLYKKIKCNCQIALAVIFSLLISACASAPEPIQKLKEEVEKVYKVVAKRSPKKDSQFYIKQAESSQAGQENRLYQQAAQQAIAENRPAEYIQKILKKISPDEITNVKNDLKLAKLYLQFDLIEEGKTVVTRLQRGSLPRQLQLDLRLLQIQVASTQNLHLETVKQAFQIQSLYGHALSKEENKLLANIIWRHLFHIPAQTLHKFKMDFGQIAQPWVELVDVINRNIESVVSLQKQLKNWQQQFSEFAKSSQMPSIVNQLLSTPSITASNILVLLPFNGKLAEQAKHIRNGLLTALGNDASTNMTFFDTSDLDVTNLKEVVAEQNIDFIIGPLQKDNVELVQNSDLNLTQPILYLNKPNNIVEPSNTAAPSYYFALSPEDEIKQAVTHFIEQNITHPTVIYSDNSLGQRLAAEFKVQWNEQTGNEPEIIAYQSKTKLEKAVRDLLDVSASNQRIKQIKGLFGNTVKTETRSRMDIDAVYVIANAQHTRLIKPYFDVNVSTFGQRLPVFSSSRSYVVGETNTQKRDLNGLTFTEMPWLIQQDSPAVEAVYQQVGTPQTQLKKLFAFGYDAFSLIHMLPTLDVLDDYQVKALTGHLSINNDKTIKRQLNWSQYQQGKVIAVN